MKIINNIHQTPKGALKKHILKSPLRDLGVFFQSEHIYYPGIWLKVQSIIIENSINNQH